LIISYNKNILFGNDQFDDIFNKKSLTVGLLFEKYPFFYLKLSEIKNFKKNIDFKDYCKNNYFYLNQFEGKEVNLIKNVFKIDDIFVKFTSIESELRSFDLICGGIIESEIASNYLNNFFPIIYYSEKVLLIKNKKESNISFNKIIENKIEFGVKLYSISYYLTEELANIKKYSFYSDLLSQINNGIIKYAIIDEHDINKINFNFYKNIEIIDIIYQENYAIFINKKYIKNSYKLEQNIKKLQESLHD
jgi:hypothetical protein